MAKLTGPLFSMEARGTMGGAVTYQKGFGGNRATRVPRHRDALTSGQVTQRSVFQVASDEWRWLGAEGKAGYARTGAEFRITGWNYFLREFLKGRVRGDTRLLLPAHEGPGASVLLDRSGYGNDGAIVGATWVQRANGLWVLSYDGAADYVNCGDDPSLDVGTGDFTMEARVKTSYTVAGQYIMSKREGVIGYEMARHPSGSLNLFIGDSGGYSSMTPGPTVPADGLEHDVAIACDRDGLATFYVDGETKTQSIATRNGSLDNASILTLSSAGGEKWKGDLFSHILTHRALTVGEIRARCLARRKFYA